MPAIPDLLHHEPVPRGNHAVLREALRFAFEAGDAGGLLSDAVGTAPATTSTWEPSAFADHVFLTELIDSCFRIPTDGGDAEMSIGHFRGVLSRPPAERRDTVFRQEALREVAANDSLRAELRRLHGALCRLRALLDAGHLAPIEGVQRKVDVLTTAKEVIDILAGGFEGARSGIGRLRELGLELREGAGYEGLVRLLDFEGNVATMDVRVRIGSDGRIRALETLALRDNRDNPLLPSVLRRLFARFWSLLRGYRVTGSEVLIGLVDQVFRGVEEAIVRCLLLTGEVEFYLAGLAFRDLAEAKGLAVCLPEIVPAPAFADPTQVKRQLSGVFNPLLLLQGIVPIPCDIETRGHDAVVVLTGPNSGGKTRLLQAIALVQLLGQSGLYVPAASARLVWAPTLFVSLVDAADADQREGRLGTELMRIRRVFEQLEPGSLVMLDELCEGTNPSEGEAIFEMVLSLLPRLRPQLFITTHFLELAARLERTRPVDRLELLQVDLDARDQPTFQFVPGVAPTSLAQKVATRLGVTRDELSALIDQKAAAQGPASAAPEPPAGGVAATTPREGAAPGSPRRE